MSSRFRNMSEELFQILKGSGKVLTLFDAQGRKVYEPASARKFFAEPDKMMISVNEDGSDSSINLYLSNTMDLKVISGLINTLRSMSSRYDVILDVKKYGKELSPKDFAYQAIGEATMWGSTKTSYQKIGNAKLVVRHCAPVREDVMGSRGRNILSLFVETKAGERLKFPVCHLSGARAWAKHLSEGGAAHDAMGTYIVELAQEATALTKLSRYTHYARKTLSEEAQGVRSQLRQRIAEVRKVLQSLSRNRGYAVALESKVYENQTVIKEHRQDAVELECQRLSDLLNIDTNHALAETIRQAALITLGENIMTIDTTKFSQILALESVDDLIECFSSEYGFEEGNQWARHDIGLMLLPEAASAAEDYLNITEGAFEIFENGSDPFLNFASNWFSNRKENSGQEGEGPEDRDDRKSQQKIEDLAQGLKDINSGKRIADVELPDEMPGFADPSAEARYKLGLYLDADAAMQNDSLWTFISSIIDKLQDSRKLSQLESIMAGKLVSALDQDDIDEQDDVMEYYEPDSFEAGYQAESEENAEAEVYHDFQKGGFMDFIAKFYPFFNEPCDQEEPMSTSDVQGDLNGYLGKEVADLLDRDYYDVDDEMTRDLMPDVIKVAEKNGWTFDSPLSETVAVAFDIGDRVATDFGPGEVLEVGDIKIKVMLQNGDSKVVYIDDVEKVNDVPIKELAEMEAWFSQFDPSTILAPVNEAEVDHDGFNALVCNAFKDGETVATISGWSLVKPDVIEDMLIKAGLMDAEEPVAEAEISEKSQAETYPNNPYAKYSDDGVSPKDYEPAISNHPLYDDLYWMSDDDNYSQADCLEVAKKIAKDTKFSSLGILKYVDIHGLFVPEKHRKPWVDKTVGAEMVQEVAAVPAHFEGGELEMNDAAGFVAYCEDTMGSMIAQQASDIIEGEAYHEQNDNALRYIANAAKFKNEIPLQQSIEAYLSGQVEETKDMGDDFINDVKRADGEDEADNALVGDLAYLRRMAGVKK